MNSTLSKVFIFIAGGAIGAAVTWKLTKDHYAKIASDEIGEMRKYFIDSTYKNKSENEEQVEEEDIKPFVGDNEDIREYAAILAKNGYTDYSTGSKRSKTSGGSEEQGEIDILKPEVIPPDEFGDILEYDTISLTLYADDVLVDDYTDEVVKDIEGTVTSEALNSFGEWDDNSVFVRNDEHKCYYEITRDERNHADIEPTSYPPKEED